MKEAIRFPVVIYMDAGFSQVSRGVSVRGPSAVRVEGFPWNWEDKGDYTVMIKREAPTLWSERQLVSSRLLRIQGNGRRKQRGSGVTRPSQRGWR